MYFDISAKIPACGEKILCGKGFARKSARTEGADAGAQG